MRVPPRLICLALLGVASTRWMAAQIVPRHYSLDLAVSAGALAVTAQVQTTASGRQRELDFSLDPTLRLTTVAVDSIKVSLPASAGGQYRIALPTEWEPASQHVLLFRYSGSPPAPNRISPGQVELYPSTDWYPKIGDSSFTAELTVSLPARMTAVTRGRMESSNSRNQQHWRDVHASAELGLFAHRDMLQLEREAPGIGVRVYSFEGTTGVEPAAVAQRAIRYYRMIAQRLGERHQPSLISIVITPTLIEPCGDGTLTFLPAMPTSPDASDLALSTAIASLWWGGAPGTAPGDVWLSSGLAGISALEALSDASGPAARAAQLPALQRTARLHSANLQTAGEQGGEPVPVETPLQDRSIRRREWMRAKSALVLNALRLEMGDAGFSSLLRAFADVSTSHPEQQTSGEFERQVERAQRTDFGWFWKQWLQRPDLPIIDFVWKQVRLPRSGRTVQVRIRQTGEPFGFRAPIAIHTGRRNYLQPVEVHNRDTILGIPVKGGVESVEFDPDQELLRAQTPQPSLATLQKSQASQP